jgi:hypothetical protein
MLATFLGLQRPCIRRQQVFCPNVGNLLTVDAVSHPTALDSSSAPRRELRTSHSNLFSKGTRRIRWQAAHTVCHMCQT